MAAGAPVRELLRSGPRWVLDPSRVDASWASANRVVDSASIEVNRRARRAKTDRLDALKLVRMLVRVCGGERRVWSEVRVPPAAAEAARQVSRERTALTAGSDAAHQSDARVCGDVGVCVAAPAAPRLVDDGARLGWRGVAGVRASAAGAGGLAAAGARRADRGVGRAAAEGAGRGGADECGPATGAAEGRGRAGRVSVTRGRVGLAGVPESPPDRRAAGIYPDALREWGVEAWSKGSVARAMRGSRP